MIAGKGLSNNVLIVEVVQVLNILIQHIEFIPVPEMLDFFTPTIPMFALGSKEKLFSAMSSLPIIGKNGGNEYNLLQAF